MVVFSGLGEAGNFQRTSELLRSRRNSTGSYWSVLRVSPLLVDSLSQFSSGIFHARARAITLLFAVTLETAAEYFLTFPPSVNDLEVDPSVWRRYLGTSIENTTKSHDINYRLGQRTEMRVSGTIATKLTRLCPRF